MKIIKSQIKQISEELQCEMLVYLNKKTHEIRSILDPDDMFSDSEMWEEEQEKIEKEWDDYITIEKMVSWEAFKIMEAFVYEVEDERMQEDLVKILNRKSPFANFKAEVETSLYRQKWFDFRDKMYEEYVVESLESEGIEIEDS